MMHSIRWLPRLGVRECAPTHGPASSALGLLLAWDMLGRGGEGEMSQQTHGPGVGCHLSSYAVCGRNGNQPT